MYNAASHIQETLNSILDQEYSDYEIIVVDDGSTDDSYIVVKRTVEHSNRKIHLLFQNNAGPNEARNFGIENAQGRYLLFLDSDDRFSEGAIGKIAHWVEEYDADFINFGYRFYDSHSKKIVHQSNYTSELIYGDDILIHSFVGKQISGVCWNKCIKRDFLNRHGIRFYPDKLHARDILFTRQCAKHASKVAIVPEWLVLSQFRYGSFSRNFNHKNIVSALDLSEKLEQEFASESPHIKTELDASIGRHLRYILTLNAFRSKSYSQYKRNFLIFRSSPYNTRIKCLSKDASFKDMVLSYLTKLPNALWVIALVLKKLKKEPY